MLIHCENPIQRGVVVFYLELLNFIQLITYQHRRRETQTNQDSFNYLVCFSEEEDEASEVEEIKPRVAPVEYFKPRTVNEGTLECEMCGIKIKQKKHFKRHMREKHGVKNDLS